MVKQASGAIWLRSKRVAGNKLTYVLKLDGSEQIIKDVTKVGLLTRTELSGDFFDHFQRL